MSADGDGDRATFAALASSVAVPVAAAAVIVDALGSEGVLPSQLKADKSGEGTGWVS